MTKDDIDYLIKESKYGAIAINKDDAFVKELYTNGRFIVFDNYVAEIFKVNYKSNDLSDYHERTEAISHLFKVWTYLGFNKNKAKDPFKSKSFVKELYELIDTTNTIYIIIKMCKVQNKESKWVKKSSSQKSRQ